MALPYSQDPCTDIAFFAQDDLLFKRSVLDLLCRGLPDLATILGQVALVDSTGTAISATNPLPVSATIVIPGGLATEATQLLNLAELTSIDGKITTCNTNAVTITAMPPVTVGLPVGASTAALQVTGNASLASIDGKITTCNTGAITGTVAVSSIPAITGTVTVSSLPSITGSVTVSASALPSGASTSALQTSGNASLTSIDGKITSCDTRNVSIGDSSNLDAFSRLRTADPYNLFNEQSQYNYGTIQMEIGNTGTGVLPAHDGNIRMTKLSATAGSGISFIQSFFYIPYQPSRSQMIAMTGVIGAAVAGAVVDMGYFDANNGIIFRQNGTTNLQLVQRTSTSGAPSDASAVGQSSWNIDKLDGTGVSGLTLDITKGLVLVIDLQYLGMGRVRIGFDINGRIFYAHEFRNANNLVVPYMQTASLPVGMLITATATGSTKDSYFKCAAVSSEGGNLDLFGFLFSTPEGNATAGNGTRTPILAIRPKTTFNSIPNRQFFELTGLAIVVTGNNAIYWELVIGGNYSGQAWSDVNTIFSGIEYLSTPGSYTNLTGGAVIASGYCTAGAGTPVTLVNLPSLLSRKYPLTLDRAGAVRSLGTYTLLVQGIGGNSTTRASINFKEIR